MNFIDINLTEEPVDISRFKYFNSEDSPKIFIGTPIHHKYDQERVHLNKKYKPENIFHIQSFPTIQTNFFKGIPFELSPTYNNLLDDIDIIESHNLSSEKDKLDEYHNVLNKYNLSCSDCSLYFSSGIYPINGSFINLLSSNHLKIKNLYIDAFIKSNNCFQCFSGLTIFILTSNYKADEIYELLFQSEELTAIA